MKKAFLFLGMAGLFFLFAQAEQQTFEEDVIPTSAGNLKITFIGHASLYLTFNGKVIHFDPVTRYADYSSMPKADLILITHEHGDHLDTKALDSIITDKTKMVVGPKCPDKLKGYRFLTMKNGDIKTLLGIKIEAIPAYNIVHMRSIDMPYHPKGNGNGYILTIADKRIYVAGDTENTPEMKALKDIDIAFLPMNVPYTMTPEMVADAVKAFKPKILYPYHYGRTDPNELLALLKDLKDTEVRIRKMR